MDLEVRKEEVNDPRLRRLRKCSLRQYYYYYVCMYYSNREQRVASSLAVKNEKYVLVTL